MKRMIQASIVSVGSERAVCETNQGASYTLPLHLGRRVEFTPKGKKRGVARELTNEPFLYDLDVADQVCVLLKDDEVLAFGEYNQGEIPGITNVLKFAAGQVAPKMVCPVRIPNLALRREVQRLPLGNCVGNIAVWDRMGRQMLARAYHNLRMEDLVGGVTFKTWTVNDEGEVELVTIMKPRPGEGRFWVMEPDFVPHPQFAAGEMEDIRVVEAA